MYLLSATDFTGEVFVPLIDEAQSIELNALVEVVDRVCPDLVESALGYELFKEYSSYIVDGQIDGDAPAKWLNLVNGVEYTKNGTLMKWRGLRDVLRYWAYWNYRMQTYSRLAGTGGLVVTEAKNAVTLNPTEGLVTTWNRFLEFYQQANADSGPIVYEKRGIRFTDYFGKQPNGRVTLLDFLTDNPESYPNALCTTFEKQNQWGL
jgi:hypothetical protein